ncbi:GBF-interacting protein 1-like isoform X3 [Capsicum annuum]|uniref:GBF-interacting protein 1-like isoform X3 n=1 Tax=Capsicum annuum TaxID=4072 RepID=UPI001FB1631B|nr:GBF-interacting protein 1-like isoform X3 [Capsicum annuum]
MGLALSLSPNTYHAINPPSIFFLFSSPNTITLFSLFLFPSFFSQHIETVKTLEYNIYHIYIEVCIYIERESCRVGGGVVKTTMSSNNKRGGARVSIPSSVRKTIQNIKEITGNHSEDEIYAMLKECSMDPNETAQKLLFQDTFHEVKSKRDRRRENLNKESCEPRWKPAMQGRGNKGSRGNFTSLHVSLDAGSGRNSGPDKDNGASHVSGKSVNLSSVPTVEGKNTSSSSSARANGPGVVAFGSNCIVLDAPASAGSGIKQSEATAAGSIKPEEPLQSPSHDVNRSPRVSVGTKDRLGRKMPNFSNSSASLSSPPSSGAYFSASDPVLLPSHGSRPPGAVGTIRREVNGQRAPFEHVPTNSNGSKTGTAVSDSRSSTVQVNMSSKFQGSVKNQLPESPQSASLAQSVSSISRPTSNYNNRSPLVGPQKAGPGKEWKPKPTNNNIVQVSATSAVGSSDVSTESAEVDTQLQPSDVDIEIKKGTFELQQKLEKSCISDVQPVIIPNHLHVPEAEKLGFCFGTFEASLGLGVSANNTAESEKTPSLSGASEGIEEMTNEQFLSDQNPSTTAEGADCSDQSPPSGGQESFSAKPEDVSSSLPEYSESKLETLQGGHQYSVVHTSPNYSFGFVPPPLSSRLEPFENFNSQFRDVFRLPNFVGGNTLVLSTAAPTSLATQAAGLVRSSAAVTQQPVFRQAAGMHLPHYPPNYIPYAHYFSPYYVQPTAIHQFLNNGAFPQQLQAGSVYPSPPTAAARYSLSQYRPGANVGNSTHINVPGTYGPYGSSTSSYSTSSTTGGGNPVSNEDLSASSFKDSQQQSEGAAVWITPGRDLSSLQASSFYNLPQGQVAFTPTQPGHGNIAGLYHPAQPVTAETVHPLIQQSPTMAGSIDMVGPTATVYQQPQHSQINWPSSY